MSHRTPDLKGQATILQSTLANEGIAVKSGFVHELVAKLNGYASWNVAAQKARKPPHTEKPTPLKTTSLVSVFEINMLDVLGDYEDPEQESAWKWVESHVSFVHTGNGIEPSVWEIMVLSSTLKEDLSDVPLELQDAVTEGLASGAKWLLFFQW